MSCCPPNAEKFLAPDYNTTGKTSTLPSGLEFYETGSTDSKKGVLVIPDVWGWNSGRVRNIADMLGENGYYCIIPKLMVPPLEGGTDGDGLYPTFSFETDLAKFIPYFGAMDYNAFLLPKIEEVVGHLKAAVGVEQLHTMGFCWGGWVMAHMLSGPLANNFLCGSIPHPSITLEEKLYQRDVATLVGTVNKPLFFMSTVGDPDEYKQDGEWFQKLYANHPTSKTVDFPKVNHGFCTRGDMSDADVATGIKEVLQHTLTFFAAHEHK